MLKTSIVGAIIALSPLIPSKPSQISVEKPLNFEMTNYSYHYLKPAEIKLNATQIESIDAKVSKEVEKKKIQALEKQKAEEKQRQAQEAVKKAVAVKQESKRVVTTSEDQRNWLQSSHIPESAWSDAIWLVNKESSWNPQSVNKSSGSCGLPQSLPCSKMNCALTDPVCQLNWMHKYVMARYKTWSNAVAHSKRFNWY